MSLRTLITATGSYIPTVTVKNSDFLNNKFFDSSGKLIDKPPEEIVRKFEEITGIKERRYARKDQVTSDLGYLSAVKAIESSRIDPESLDYIIVAHNFGDVSYDNRFSSFVPSIAARIKNKLRINNPYLTASDLPFGCPGWLQALIQCHSFFKSGEGKKALIIGAETLSRISDPHDRDSMLYSDGAGATILECVETDEKVGILSSLARSDTERYAELLKMGVSYNPDYKGDNLFLKMEGNKLYKYAITYVPPLVKGAILKAGLSLEDISKIFIHQANEKMDEEIVRRIFHLFDKVDVTKNEIYDIMPMSISYLGNSSVATLPTLLDITINKLIDRHKYESGKNYVFASVGAGMNINAVVYKTH